MESDSWTDARTLKQQQNCTSRIAAATTTSSDIIISCLHCYSFPAYFQSRDYCDADTVDFLSTSILSPMCTRPY